MPAFLIQTAFLKKKYPVAFLFLLFQPVWKFAPQGVSSCNKDDGSTDFGIRGLTLKMKIDLHWGSSCANEELTLCFIVSLQNNLFIVFLKARKTDRGMLSAWRHNLNTQHSNETTTSVLQMSIRELSVKLRFIETAGWSRPNLRGGFRSR